MARAQRVAEKFREMMMSVLPDPNVKPTLTTAEAAELLGVSADLLWKLARNGGAPVEPLRLGRALRWPTKPLVDLVRGQTPNARGNPA